MSIANAQERVKLQNMQMANAQNRFSRQPNHQAIRSLGKFGITSLVAGAQSVFRD
jgi:hypothetical protein